MSLPYHLDPVAFITDLPHYKVRTEIELFNRYDLHDDTGYEFGILRYVASALHSLEIMEKCVDQKVNLLDALVGFWVINVAPEHAAGIERHLAQRDYASRVKAVEQQLAGLDKKRILLSAISAPAVFSKVDSLYSKTLPFKERMKVQDVWFAAVRDGDPSQARLEDPGLRQMRTKMLSDLNRSLDEALASMATSEQFVAVYGSPRQATFPLVHHLLSAFTVKSLGEKRMVVIPRLVRDYLNEQGLSSVRCAAIDPDPVLLETAIALWDDAFEANYGSFKALVETARALI